MTRRTGPSTERGQTRQAITAKALISKSPAPWSSCTPPTPARLAYTGPDGYPRVIPIGFLWNDTAVVVCTAPSAPKVTALAKLPHVALTIDTMGPPARELLLRGTATVEIVDGVAPEYLAAAAKSTRGDELAAFEAAVRGLYKEMARITITPSWSRFYDFGAGRRSR